MSNNEITNDEKDVIESKAVEGDIEVDTEVDTDLDSDIEQDPIEEKEQDQHQPETVVIKKGGFFSFLTFLLSIAALGISAFMYYQQYLLDQQQGSDEPQWQQPLADMDNKFNKQINAFAQQLNSVKANHQQVQGELKALQKAQQLRETQRAMPQAVQQETPQAISTTAYDDAEIKQQIATIERKITAIGQSNNNELVYDDAAVQQKLQTLEVQLSEESKKLTALQNAFKASQVQQQEKIQQLFSNAQEQQQNQVSSKAYIEVNNHNRALIAATLQASQIQLNINGNVKQSLNLLTGAQQQLQESQQQQFVTFADELNTTIQQIKNVPILDAAVLHTQINDLVNATEQLSFAGQQAQASPKKETSWFDNLITVRKIEDDSETVMTAAEQQNIRNAIKAHYGLLKNALINKNQTAWSSQIADINSLLQQYFAAGSDQIQKDLQQLNTVVLNPAYPDLSELIKLFNAINIEQSGD